jgi:hypothetical protein
MDYRYIRHTYYPDNNQESVVTDTRNASVARTTYPEKYYLYSASVASIIKTVEKGVIEGQLFLGGINETARGDRVGWGYFYADPADVSWGSVNNPEVFFKIWGDISGRGDANFFHVSVPDIEVASQPVDEDYNEVTSFQESTVTMDRRYSRHEYIPE